MKTFITRSLAGMTLAAVLISGPMGAFAGDSKVLSLRGGTALNTETVAVPVNQPLTDGQFERNYRQQPPLIPHETADFTIDSTDNTCLSCHDWPQNVGAGAPKVSETHYVARDGKRLDHVSTARWFCTQCHVTQDDTEALIPNTFTPSTELE